MLSCPNNSCKALISTFPYLYINVAAVCLNLCTEYLSAFSIPANFNSCFTIYCTVLLLILFFCSLKNRASLELNLTPSMFLTAK